jgi:TonB family protein
VAARIAHPGALLCGTALAMSGIDESLAHPSHGAETMKRTFAALSATLLALALQGMPASPAVADVPAAADQRLAMIPSGEREDLSVPESKKAMIAYLAVPEVAPVATRSPLPAYPEFARQTRLHGMVYARLLVDETGKVVQVGPIRGHAALRQAVRSVVGQWEFAPARQGDRPVRAWVTVPCSFEL